MVIEEQERMERERSCDTSGIPLQPQSYQPLNAFMMSVFSGHHPASSIYLSKAASMDTIDRPIFHSCRLSTLMVNPRILWANHLLKTAYVRSGNSEPDAGRRTLSTFHDAGLSNLSLVL
ncbi:hypothetical protein BU17DRAFT_65279 [Hysterangium stoloniferum]|nr:hypothetical protein BU17DRAFT_72121 [Hysterangium stoloniferum]KAF8520581.1 hypothetical protein BU17DRAFT_65279 [Hysterangium stoloniferum]